MKNNRMTLGLGLEIAGSSLGARPALPLARSSFIRLDRSAGTTITCVEGMLWITQEGDRDDHLLSAGESFTVAKKGLTVVGAEVDSRVQVA